MKTGLVITVLAVIVLTVFNPGMDEFRTFVRVQAEEIIQKEAGDNALGRVLSGAGGSLAGEYVDRVTERSNYVVFSTYTIDLDGAESNTEEWRFLGVAGRFLELDRPQSMDE